MMVANVAPKKFCKNFLTWICRRHLISAHRHMGQLAARLATSLPSFNSQIQLRSKTRSRQATGMAFILPKTAML